MDNKKDIIHQFFDDYAQRFNNVLKGAEPDIDIIIASFAVCFIEANPLGVMCGKNDKTFREQIPVGYSFYKEIGINSMDILSREITILDDYHAMAKIHWNSVFTKGLGQAGNIEFDVIYLLQLAGGHCKIFAYITGDEQRALRENGLI